jgi:hypothetical protein
MLCEFHQTVSRPKQVSCRSIAACRAGGLAPPPPIRALSSARIGRFSRAPAAPRASNRRRGLARHGKRGRPAHINRP